MKATKKLKANKVISMSQSAKQIISQITHEVSGRNLFTEKIENAKRTLRNLKSLPI